MEPLEVITVMDKRAQPIPSPGLLRPVVRCMALAGIMVCFLVFFLNLGERSLWDALKGIVVPLALCVVYLIVTRTRYVMKPMSLTISFYPDHLIWERQMDNTFDFAGRPRGQKRVDTIAYSGLTRLRFQTLYGRVEIYGIILCQIFRQGKNGALQQTPFYRKQTSAAVSAWLQENNTPEDIEYLLTALERCTGKKVERYDPTAGQRK